MTAVPFAARTATRRAFLGGTAAVATGAGLLGLAHPAAATAKPYLAGTGSLDDVEHVVILMQENRSTDHYFGTMRGVRGFADKAALRGVFQQPEPSRKDGGYLRPYRLDTAKVDGQSLDDNEHSWWAVHDQWNHGANDGFARRGHSSMAYYGDTDIPFSRALAEAFTFCDNYFCSIKGPTTPNRLYHWTGTIDPSGHAGGPVVGCPSAYPTAKEPKLDWMTYPERLQDQGISWRIYASDEMGSGSSDEDRWVGEFGCNPLWLFKNYQDALTSTLPRDIELVDRASLRTQWQPNSGQGTDPAHVLAKFVADCAPGGNLPKVSWVIAPGGYSEHPKSRPVDGAAFIETMLQGIWANPELWSKTVVLINYDEHDGFFDHVIPPTAPSAAPDEFVNGAPIGLGPRVPMTVISPWSRGNWINSQVFDHTSVLRFLEVFTGVKETNISAWRRAICGDLTSCFDFATPDVTIPLTPNAANTRRAQVDTIAQLPASTAPGKQVVPVQDPGTVAARALPYQPWANLGLHGSTIQVTLGNQGSAAVQLQVYDLVSGAPAQRIDVAAGKTASASVAAGHSYDVAVYGPNGFLREAKGTPAASGMDSWLRIGGTRAHPVLQLSISNWTRHAIHATVAGIGASSTRVTVWPGTPRTLDIDPYAHKHGWYDLVVRVDDHPVFLRRFAGHLENGAPSITG